MSGASAKAPAASSRWRHWPFSRLLPSARAARAAISTSGAWRSSSCNTVAAWKQNMPAFHRYLPLSR